MSRRLLLVTNDYPPAPGGIQQFLRGFVNAYDGPVRVLAPRHERADDVSDVVRRDADFLWPTRSVGDWVVDHGKSFRPDVVVFGAPTPLPLLTGRVRRELGAPVVVVAHGAEMTVPSLVPGVRSLLRRALRAPDEVVALSPWTARVVGRLRGRPAALIGTGVDLTEFHPPADPLSAPPVVVGCVSRFVPRKGHGRVLRTVARLRAEGFEVEALMGGSGRLERKLRDLAAELEVPTRFAVDVPYSQLGDLYRSTHVFAMPARSRWFGLEAEGLGLVYLEAAACGLPVITGDSGGAPSTIVPGHTGFVAHDDRSLEAAVRMLVADAGMRAEMGEAGRRRIEAEFTWPATIARFHEAVSAAVANR